MKIKLLFFLCFYCASIIAQKKYEFDYVIEYQNFEKKPDQAEAKKTHVSYEFFNSKDNSYAMTVLDNGSMTRMWLTLNTGETFYGEIISEDFFVIGISLKCPQSWKRSEGAYEKLKDYALLNPHDTIIESKQYKSYIVNALKKRSNNKHSNHYKYPLTYVIDNSLNLNIPIVNPTALLYRKWKNGENVPNGVIKDIYMDSGNEKVAIIKMLQCIKTQKIIFIDKNCR